MAFIDGTVVNVALPVLQADFHATRVDVHSLIMARSIQGVGAALD